MEVPEKHLPSSRGKGLRIETGREMKLPKPGLSILNPFYFLYKEFIVALQT